MYCKRCGAKNKDDALFCANCGQKLKETPVQHKEPELETKKIEYKEPVSTKKPIQKNWIIAIVCVIVVVAGIIGYQFSKSKNKKESAATAQQKTTEDTTQKVRNKTQGEDVADSKDGTDAENTANSQDKDTDDGQDLPYTNNKKMDLTACTDPDNYYYFTAKDKSFGFLYPKYLFNECYVSDEGDQYILEHSTGSGEDDSDYAAVITKTEDVYADDPVSSVKHIFEKTKSKMEKVTFEYPKGRDPKIYDGGKASMCLEGYLDNDLTQCQYLLATSDGKYTYTMSLTFKDPDYKNEHNKVDYIADCMYRGCSFTNSTKQIRSFENFKKDEE